MNTDTNELNEMNEAEQELCRMLIQLDLLTRDQVNDAFLYLCKLQKSEIKPIDEIFVELELISPSMLDQVKQMYQQASQIYGHNPITGKVVTPETRPSLQPIPKTKRRLMQTPIKTAELRLSPELQNVIKNGNKVSATQVTHNVTHKDIQEAIERAEAMQDFNTESTLLIFPGGPKTDKAQETAVQADIKAPLPMLSNPFTQKIDPFKTLVFMPEAQTKPSEHSIHPERKDKIIQPPPPLAPQPNRSAPSASPFSGPKQTPIHPPLSLSLPDLNTKAPQNSLPQIGEILLKNHDLEEWQLMHALCIQKEAPQGTARLGTLLVKLGYVNRQAVERALSLQLAEELKSDIRMVS